MKKLIIILISLAILIPSLANAKTIVKKPIVKQKIVKVVKSIVKKPTAKVVKPIEGIKFDDSSSTVLFPIIFSTKQPILPFNLSPITLKESPTTTAFQHYTSISVNGKSIYYATDDCHYISRLTVDPYVTQTITIEDNSSNIEYRFYSPSIKGKKVGSDNHISFSIKQYDTLYLSFSVNNLGIGKAICSGSITFYAK